jgi:hypothetical protein
MSRHIVRASRSPTASPCGRTGRLGGQDGHRNVDSGDAGDGQQELRKRSDPLVQDDGDIHVDRSHDDFV